MRMSQARRKRCVAAGVAKIFLQLGAIQACAVNVAPAVVVHGMRTLERHVAAEVAQTSLHLGAVQVCAVNAAPTVVANGTTRTCTGKINAHAPLELAMPFSSWLV